MGGETVLYFDCGGGYMTLHACESWQKWMLKLVNFTTHKLYSVNLTKKEEKRG